MSEMNQACTCSSPQTMNEQRVFTQWHFISELAICAIQIEGNEISSNTLAAGVTGVNGPWAIKGPWGRVAVMFLFFGFPFQKVLRNHFRDLSGTTRLQENDVGERTPKK